MKNRITPIVLIIVFAFLHACNSPKPEKKIEGKLKKEVISFAPKIPGRILEIYVEEGQVVEIGDTLALLDIPEVDAKIKQAEGATQTAQMQAQMAKNGATKDQMRQLNAKQKGLKEQYEYARKSYLRAQNMYKDSLLSPQNFDEISAKYHGAKAQLDAVNAEVNDVFSGTRYEQLGMAEGQASQARGALQEAKVASSERYIIATNAMEIETITLRKGELATAGFALFNGYIPQSTYFRFTIPESKIGSFEKGKSIQMKSTFGDSTFSGTIQTIKQLTKYADITTAFPDYKPEEAIYEIKVKPEDQSQVSKLLVNSNVELID